jgi:acetolactate synthase-1/2/3 large subunit
MRVADYIFDFFYNKGITNVFSLVGGGSMYLNDAVSKSKMEVIYCHHEQACAMSAVGYTKYLGIPSIVLVTTGCGSTNTITGLLDEWQDSVPIIFISGQVKNTDFNPDLRQAGVQGVNIKPIISSIVKGYNNLSDNIEVSLRNLYFNCITDRKGPVWLEIPLNIQKAEI